MSLLPVIFCVFLSATRTFQQSPQRTADGSFDQYTNAELTCSTPIESLAGQKLETCADRCKQRADCQSANYFVYGGKCDLFAQTGKVDLSSQSRPDCSSAGPTVTSSRGVAYLQKVSQGYVPSTTTPGYAGLITTQPPTYGPQTTVPPTYAQTEPTTQPPVPDTTPQPNTPPPTTPQPDTPPTTPCCVPQPDTTTPGLKDDVMSTPSTNNGCAADESAVMIKTTGTRFVGASVTSFVAASESQCIQSCINNQQPSGETLNCKSAVYSSEASTCSVTDNTLAPSGTLTSESKPTSNYYEKMCFKTADVSACSDVFNLDHQHILTGYARSVISANTLTACIQECINAVKNFGFQCQSVMFYYDTKQENCILNSESRSTQPALYIPTPSTAEQVDYVDSGCPASSIPPSDAVNVKSVKPLGSAIQIGNPEWAAWTQCDARSQNRKRFRNCSTYQPKNCSPSGSESCTPDAPLPSTPAVLKLKRLGSLVKLTTRAHRA